MTATCRADNAQYARSLGATSVLAYDRPAQPGLPPQDIVFDLMGGRCMTRAMRCWQRAGIWSG